MEKLKYRAWDKEFEEMLQVQAVICNPKALLPKGERMEPYILDEHNDIHYFDDIEILPYTGLKDKKGVEIYEGDIVACYSLTHPNEKYIGKIVFMSEEFKIIWYDGEILRLNKIRFWANSRNIEVIGNIFENTKLKELLEGE